MVRAWKDATEGRGTLHGTPFTAPLNTAGEHILKDVPAAQTGALDGKRYSTVILPVF